MAPINPKDPKSMTVRKSLELHEEKTGKRSPRLDAVKVPEGFEYLYEHFWQVRTGVESGFSGPQMTWRDLESYERATGVHFDAFESGALIAMDRAAASALGELRTKWKLNS